jgi:hypothetical protein
MVFSFVMLSGIEDVFVRMFLKPFDFFKNKKTGSSPPSYKATGNPVPSIQLRRPGYPENSGPAAFRPPITRSLALSVYIPT